MEKQVGDPGQVSGREERKSFLRRKKKKKAPPREGEGFSRKKEKGSEAAPASRTTRKRNALHIRMRDGGKKIAKGSESKEKEGGKRVPL